MQAYAILEYNFMQSTVKETNRATTEQKPAQNRLSIWQQHLEIRK